MNSEQLIRYSRHILLPQIDIKGQEKLLQSHVLVIGCGGLGSGVIPYLSSSGVGHLTLIDDDKIDLSNLQRQTHYRFTDVNRLKVDAMNDMINQLNPDIQVNIIKKRLETKELLKLAQSQDVIIDCSDNITTRLQINLVAVKTQKPLIFGSAIRFEGQLAIFDTKNEESACYACLYGTEGSNQDTCSYAGIFAPVVGIIGAKQATEALKIILGFKPTYLNKLYHFNSLTSEEHYFEIVRNTDCPVCQNR